MEEAGGRFRPKESGSEAGGPDLAIALYTAIGLLERDWEVGGCRYKKYAGLKAKAELKENRVFLSVSDGFIAADQDVLAGLCLSLMCSLAKRRVPKSGVFFTEKYRQFISSRGSAELSDVLRKMRGQKTKANSAGKFYDLKEVRDAVIAGGSFEGAFLEKGIPEIGWTPGKSKSRLGFYDSAKNRVMISSFLDSDRVPWYVVHYVVFHELLHCKHGILYERGISLRRTVHPRAFKKEEKTFPFFAAAEKWIRGI